MTQSDFVECAAYYALKDKDDPIHADLNKEILLQWKREQEATQQGA